MTAPASDTPRQRRRWGRTLLLLVLGFIGLIVVVLAILPYVLSLDSIKAQVLTQAEASLNRNVELGQVRLQIFTGLGAGLEPFPDPSREIAGGPPRSGLLAVPEDPGSHRAVFPEPI